MEGLINFFNNIFSTVGNAGSSLLHDVMVPAADSFVGWFNKYVPIWNNFADFCTSLFRFKYQIRIYSFMILLPLTVLLILCCSMRRKRRLKRAQRKINGAKEN